MMRRLGIMALGLCFVALACAWRFNPADRTNLRGLNTAKASYDTALTDVTTLQGQMTTVQSQIGSADADQIDVAYSADTATTNGQAVTVTDTLMRLNSQGVQDAGTNTITLVDPLVIGRTAYLYNSGSSNRLAIAQTGNWISPAVEVAPYGLIKIISVATNKWAGLQ